MAKTAELVLLLMSSLLIATRNTNKTREIGQMLGPAWKVSDLSSIGDAPIIEETGLTFEENATLKAIGVSRRCPGRVLADDSGLEVDALDGEPGVFSARYAGSTATDEANRKLLISKLRERNLRSGVPGRFRCVMVLAENDEILGAFAGAVEGTVITTERGEGGFGYDSLFVPEGYEETFAELPATIKNTLSHRARALSGVIAFLRNRSALNVEL
jgi:XTP/dITP diphosphohydrolase